MLKVSSSNLHKSSSVIDSTLIEHSLSEKTAPPVVPPLEATTTASSISGSCSTVVSTEGDETHPPTMALAEKTISSNPLSFLANVTLDMFGINKAPAAVTTASVNNSMQETPDPAVVVDGEDATKNSPSIGPSDNAMPVNKVGSTQKERSKKPMAVSPSNKASSSAPNSVEKTKKRKGGSDVTTTPSPRKARKGDAARVAEHIMATSALPSTVKNAVNGTNSDTAAAVSSKRASGMVSVPDEDDNSSGKDESAEYNAYLASYASAVKDAQSVLDRVDPPMSRFSESLLSRQRQLEHDMDALRKEEFAVLRERELANALREQELLAALRQQRQQHEMMANMDPTLSLDGYGSSIGGRPPLLSRLELQIQHEMQRQHQALLECRLLNGSSLGPSSSLLSSSPSGLGGATYMGGPEASYLAGLTRGPVGSIPPHLLPIQSAHHLTATSRFLASAAGSLTYPITGDNRAAASETVLVMNRSSPAFMGVSKEGPSTSILPGWDHDMEETSAQTSAPKRLAPARGVFNKNIKTQDEVLDSLARANNRYLKGDDGKKSGQRFRSYQCEQWSSKFQELLSFKDQMGNCQVPHAYKKNVELARWVKRQRYQYKLMVEGKQSTMTAERVKLLEGIGFIWDSHAATWEERLNELRDYASVNGDCNVPSSYRENPKLATWIKCQRRQFKLLQEGKTSNMTLERMTELERAGICWRVQER